MKKRFFSLLVLLSILSACALPSATPTQNPLPPTPNFPPVQSTSATTVSGPADTIFLHGAILTMQEGNPTAQAIAVRGGAILAVGNDSEISALQDSRTQVIDLNGLTLMPGFVDAHSHTLNQRLLDDQDPLPDQQMTIQFGITTEAEFFVDESILNKLKALAEAGELRMRVNVYLLYTNNCGDLMGDWWKAYQPNQQIAPNLFLRGLKIFSDGGSCKAPAMSVEYPGGGKGDLFFSQDQMNQIVAEAQAAGFQVAIHALGDRAVEEAQNAIAFALNGQPNTYRHRIEHNATIRPDLLPRYGEIGIVPIIFGTYSTCIRATGEGKKFKYILGEEYGAWDWPWRALADANPGLPIAWQSDYPIFPTNNPLYHLWGMVTRKEINADGSICNPPDWVKAGALRVEEVLPMMTRNSAYALFFDKEVGTLEAGKFADLVILSDNPLQVESDSIKDMSVLMTMIGGKVEYCATGFESLCPSASPSDVGAGSPVATASASLSDSPASNAIDGNIETIWNSGAGPEQWIQIDLGKPAAIRAIRLHVSQYPEGETTHQLWVGADANNLTLIHKFSGFTRDFDILGFTPSTPLTNIRYIRIVTTKSSSWVAWREIEIK